MPEIHCHCGHLFAVKSQFAGLPVACPRCNATHQVAREAGHAPLTAEVVEEPLLVQPMSQPVGYAPAGVRKPPASNNNANLIIILLCVGGAMVMFGLIFAVGVIFVFGARQEPPSADSYVSESPVFIEPPAAVESSEPTQLEPRRFQSGTSTTNEFRRKMIYRSARVRLRGPSDMLKRARERNMPERIRQSQVRSMQRMIESTRKSICTQYQISPQELDAILAEGASSGW